MIYVHSHNGYIPIETLRETRLSPPAYRCLLYLLSYRTRYEGSISGLGRTFGVSRKTMAKWLKELEDAQYLERECHRGRDGMFFWHHTVYAEPKPIFVLHTKERNERHAKIVSIETKIALWGKEA